MDIEIRFNSLFLLIWRKRFKRWGFRKLYRVFQLLEKEYHRGRWFQSHFNQRRRADVYITIGRRTSVYICGLDKRWEIYPIGVTVYDYTKRAEIVT